MSNYAVSSTSRVGHKRRAEAEGKHHNGLALLYAASSQSGFSHHLWKCLLKIPLHVNAVKKKSHIRGFPNNLIFSRGFKGLIYFMGAPRIFTPC